ncbi:hypothetical protein [Dysgonomonas sp. 520]|uniref:hypothetical protein n=1 Tax=Dysgonomonas sp. 520 TaxID=2302931 RepID=UPI0013CF6A09|nr:hypothetical protein [Dysgonomonas sp. 520]NDW10754.1 hypothetical protein [Dysgonomonas sp. 520]
MTDKQEKLLHDLELRMRQLMLLCDSLRDDNLLLKEDIEKKNVQIASLSSELVDMQAKYENLKVSKALISDSNGDKEKAKVRLSKLVQEVDKCISLLKSS